MRHRSLRGQQGFSLLELLIAMTLFVLVVVGMLEMFDFVRLTYVKGESKLDVQQNARLAMDTMARELRMAGYFPENFDANTGNDLVNPQPIQFGQDFALVVFGDPDGSGASNIFLYCLRGTTIIRKRNATAAGAAAYTCANGDITNQTTLATNITGLRFTYYDGINTPVPNPLPANMQYTLDGEGIDRVSGAAAVPGFGATTQRGSVRTVLITLTGTTAVPGPGQLPQLFTLTQSVRLRNLN